MAIRETQYVGVYTDGSWLFTRNLVPGKTVYGEGLAVQDGVEYRKWDATRSKLAAYLKLGGRVWPYRASSSLLYLGAGSGTTVSHISDICSEGRLIAIEIAPRVFRNLVSVAESRPNLIPILGDATRPESYRGHAGVVDILYHDVAQRDQVGIFVRNVELLRSSGVAYLMLKARSVDVAARPKDVSARSELVLREAGLEILDNRSLDPFQKDHFALAVRKR